MKAYVKIAACALAATLICASCSRPLRDGNYTLHVLSTGDVHSTWFDSTYVGSGIRKSIFAMNHYIDSVRTLYGRGNVVLVDAGDCLQGDNAAYYFNYIDTLTPHLFPRLLKYMEYDAVAVGNHDIETGHPVYDRVTRDLRRAGADFLAGNALRTDNDKPYFPICKVIRRAGLKVAIVGYTNANIKAWLSEELWRGMTFESVASIIQGQVDAVRKKHRPDVLIVTMHSGCGRGDGTILENEALDVFNSVRGVDFLVCGHDHRPRVETRDTMVLMNSGSHSRYVAHGTLAMQVRDGRRLKTFETELIPVRAEAADTVMRAQFRKDFEAVKAFTLTEVGGNSEPLLTREAYKGVSPYMDLIHTICLSCAPAQISIAAPLTYNGKIEAGTLLYNDLFTVYPFENQLFVLNMSGREIREYLEASYDRWLRSPSLPSIGQGSASLHFPVLNIEPYDDPRTQQKGWSFAERFYNFDSAAGIDYTVDVRKGRGERVCISAMADGSPFSEDAVYAVAMTSYRASGGGGLLGEIGVDSVGDRVLERYPEIRNIIYDWLKVNGTISPENCSDRGVLGFWQFVPAREAAASISRELALLFD